ncbi:hypothetical protein [Cohnella lupini]|uniref:Uncharacterized protein n=1 Tax=Cohnella lupini TaxID=1294267 RepID=A0A3D9IYP1_9BACL|nr:hypothetical protein [Cohnella lupini]RED66196.1 hypothetical protein DFP95_101694 [Cohnella lupini]
MLIYLIFFVCFIFSLIAVFNHLDEEYSKQFLMTVVVYSVLLSIARLNSNLHLVMNSYSSTPVLILVMVALAAYMVNQYRQTDIRWR